MEEAEVTTASARTQSVREPRRPVLSDRFFGKGGVAWSPLDSGVVGCGSEEGWVRYELYHGIPNNEMTAMAA